MAGYEEINKAVPKNPKESANIFSILSFSWMSGTLSTGNTRPLENSDLFPLLDVDKTQGLTERLEETWNEQCRRWPDFGGKKKSRLWWALVSMFHWSEHVFLLSTVLIGGLCNVLQPLLLSMLLLVLMKSSTEDIWLAYVYAAGICISSLIRAVTMHHFSYNSEMMAMRWKAATIGLIFKKVLGLSQTSLSTLTNGYVMNLIAGDVQRFDLSVLYFVIIAQALFEIGAVAVLTWRLLGYQALGGIVFMASLAIYYGIMGRVCTGLRFRIAKVTDKRLNSMAAIVPGIRAVKMHAWEWPFMEMVKQLRRKEMWLIRVKSVILSTFSALIYSCQPIASCIGIAVLSASGVTLTTYNMMMILSLTTTVRVTVSECIGLPMNFLADFFAGLDRIQTLLEVHDLRQLTASNDLQRAFKLDDKFHDDGAAPSRLTPTCPTKQNHLKSDPHYHDGPQDILSLGNVTCCWQEDVNLKSVSLSISEGDLVLVTGPVGCGKSSLLMAILQELPLSQGTISCSGKIAHVPQLAWTFSGTVRENILFGQQMERNRYNKVLEACALVTDMENFPGGDMTSIGERGVLLSGGQRARVALARAVYADTDVYLLDDPLSAVDAKVGKHIFEKCICGILAQKTRIVVTHCQQFLTNAEHIVIMKEGSIKNQGSYMELRKTGIEFQDVSGDVTMGKSHVRHDNSRRDTTEDVIGIQHEEEDRLTGSVTWSLYWKYFRAGLSCWMLVSFVFFFVAAQVSLVLPDWWLFNMSNLPHFQKERKENLQIYAGLASMAFLLSVVRSLLFFNTTLNSSRALHNEMLAAVLKAPLLFFDTNPVGRVLNRFSTDLVYMDELLPETFLDAIQLVLFCTSAIVLPTVLNPWVVLVLIPLIVVFLVIGKYYVKSSRELRRLEALNRSPVFSHFADSLEGLVTIRTFKRERMFLEELYRYQDTHNKTAFLRIGSLRWLAIRLDVICVCFVTAVLCISLATQSDAGATALSLVYALQLALDTSQYGVRQCAEVENYMTSVERVMTYTEIEPEPGYEMSTQAPEEWPQHGGVQMEDMSLVYYPGGPQVLKDVSLTIKPQQRIGIAGRTGAGKSSFVAALFRMPEPAGRITVDGIDIQRLNIQSSRRVLSVITQDPILFTGTLRMNLDPFEKSQDAEIWEALHEASLKAKVTKLPKQLYEEILECGANFSVGERQLLCLARALLKKSKIMILDEATANVDYETDRLIQETIRDKFQECTVITIAHRLNTIMDYDKILVLEDGRAVEFDEPQALLKKGGMFLELYKSHHAVM